MPGPVTPARLLLALAALLVPLGAGALPAGAATPAAPVVQQTSVVTRQDVPSQGASESDTVVEPHVAVSPLDPDVAVAAAHDSRYADGGAVAISSAWTRDGGATWQHAPVPGLTTATGGPYERASDPVLAFGPDGTAYLSVLLFDASSCRTAVAVLRSSNGGRTWSAPSYAHRSATCDYSDDKNWIVVDTSAASPHRGRVYQFWTPFLSSGSTFTGSPQVVRWSDDKGVTWSATSPVTARDRGTQNSQPMILADGTLVDTFYDYGAGVRPDGTPGSAAERPMAPAGAAVVDPSGPILAARSTDGGRTWQAAGTVTPNGAGYAPGVRCCLFAADIDRQTQTLHVAWLGGGGPGDTDPVLTSSSRDGRTWSTPVRVSKGDVAGVQRVNVDIVARSGTVYVTYGTRTQPGSNGGVVQQQLSVSTTAGAAFGAPVSIGPRSVLQYAAQSRGYFPGDYIGMALGAGRLYVVFARSSAPPAASTSPYHQVIQGVTLRP